MQKNFKPISPKVQEILDRKTVEDYPITFKHYSQAVNDYINACKAALVQGIRQDIFTSRDPVAAGNRAYNKVEIFKPVFVTIGQGSDAEPGDAELLNALSLDWIVETLTTCQTCPATIDPRKCTGLCVKWGIVPK